MPDKRRHRGAHPEDECLFAADAWPTLRQAVAHLSWLRTHGYAEPSSLKLVGDRFQLAARQRIAVRRAACSDQALQTRLAKCLPMSELAGRAVAIDGFNLLTTIEAALGGGVLLKCRDHCVRDMASVHGNYRKVEETQPALKYIGRFFATLNIGKATWWLDRPVSNSGRLQEWLEHLARQNRWPWTTELVPDVDRQISKTADVVISADSGILDRCRVWSNVTPELLARLPDPIWYVPVDR